MTWFLLLGLAVGLIGTLIGAGGGFLLAPLFLFLFPDMEPAHLTALSLLAVAANSISGSIGYAVRKQVHWPSVIWFTLAALPGVFIGVQIAATLPRQSFELVFAVFLVVMSAFVIWRSFQPQRSSGETVPWTRRNLLRGAGVSFFVGILSSLLGIGGGIVHVPLLSEYSLYPIHFATGTSHAILALTSVAAVLNHLYLGDFANLEPFVPYLIVGLVIGAQLGAKLSKHVPKKWILRALGLALLLVGTRLLLRNL